MDATAGTCWLRSLGVAVLLLVATACSGDPPPAGAVKTPTPTVASSTPAPTPTPVEQQVEVAVRAYYAELTRATQTNDTTKLSLLLSKGCPCYKSVKIIQDNRRRGRSGPDADISVENIEPHDVIGHTAAAIVEIRAATYDLVDTKGNVVSHVRARTYRLDLSFVSTNDAWILHNIFNLGA